MNAILQRKPTRRGAAQLQLVPHPQLTGDRHLTGEQISDLLAAAPGSRADALACDSAAVARAQAHLRICAHCASEFASLHDALMLFHEASSAFASQEFARRRRIARSTFPVLPARRPYSQTLLWVAAGIVLMAGILPLEMRWQHTESPAHDLAASAHATGAAGALSKSASDEALLEDIDRELSASVPTPMQPLADPTGDTSPASGETAPSTSQPRKD